MIAISSILMVCMCSYEVIAGVCYRPIDRIKVILKNVKKKKKIEFRISNFSPLSQYIPSKSIYWHSQTGPPSVEIQIPPFWHGL